MSQPPRIVSPDTTRRVRIPPHQHDTPGWPVLHVGRTPDYGDLSTWTFRIFGLVEQPWQCDHATFRALPRVEVLADMHCVTTWSKLGNHWEGVSTRTVLEQVRVKPEAK